MICYPVRKEGSIGTSLVALLKGISKLDNSLGLEIAGAMNPAHLISLSASLSKFILNQKNCLSSLNIALQSGSSRIQRLMRRPQFEKQALRRATNNMRLVNPKFYFSGEIIVGFNHETDEDSN